MTCEPISSPESDKCGLGKCHLAYIDDDDDHYYMALMILVRRRVEDDASSRIYSLPNTNLPIFHIQISFNGRYLYFLLCSITLVNLITTWIRIGEWGGQSPPNKISFVHNAS